MKDWDSLACVMLRSVRTSDNIVIVDELISSQEAASGGHLEH